jgi:hexosaminidase
MLRRIAGSDDTSALRVLGDVLEPVKEYAREEQAVVPARSIDPLNRLVDAVHPESEMARQFAEMVNALLAGKADAETKVKMRQWLTLWRDNDAKLQPEIAGSFLLQEDAPLSRNLSALGDAGLQAMDYLERDQQASADWTAQQIKMNQEAAKPSAQMLLMVVEPVGKLLSAAGPR